MQKNREPTQQPVPSEHRGREETQPAVQDPIQKSTRSTLASTDFEWDLSTQKEWEALEKLKELTSRQEISAQSLLIKLRQATTHAVASTFDHRGVHTLYFLILLSLAGPTASTSPSALDFCSLSRHAMKKAVHSQDGQMQHLHTTTYPPGQRRGRLV